MKGKNFRIWVGVLLFVHPVCGQTESPPVPRIVTREGDRITGRLLSASEDTFLIQPYWSDEPFSVGIRELAGYSSGSRGRKRQEGSVRLRFTSGTALNVRTLFSTPSALMAETLWGQTAEIPAGSVSTVEFLYPEGFLYYGPMAVHPESGETFQHEVTLTGAGKQWQTGLIDFPERFLLEMEIKPMAVDFVYHISLFDWSTRRQGSVVLESTESRMSAAWYLRTLPNRLNVKNWRKEIEEPLPVQKLRLYVDLNRNMIALYLNGSKFHVFEGEYVESLRTDQPFPIKFRYLSGTGEITVSSIRISPWKGDLPGDLDLESLDVLQLKNGTRLSGLLKTFSEREVVFESGDPPGLLTFPVERVHKLFLTGESPEGTKRPPEGSGKLFVSGLPEPMQVQNLRLNEGTLTGNVWTGGRPMEVVLPLEWVSYLEFPGGKPE